MANIYCIQQELLDIFDELEENGGEFTPELEEKLNITQKEFNTKIESYANIIKSLEDDIFCIKREKDRLNSLQNSKEKTIERLKRIMAYAINQFGNIGKNGSKFIDYGTGKISIRKTESLEIDEKATNTFCNLYLAGLSWYKKQNQLDLSIINKEDLLNFANSTNLDENYEEYSTNFTEQDLEKIDANININISLKDLLNTNKGFNLAKSLIEYGTINIKPSIDKNTIKKEIKETGEIPTFANLITKENIIIK